METFSQRLFRNALVNLVLLVHEEEKGRAELG